MGRTIITVNRCVFGCVFFSNFQTSEQKGYFCVSMGKVDTAKDTDLSIMTLYADAGKGMTLASYAIGNRAVRAPRHQEQGCRQ